MNNNRKFTSSVMPGKNMPKVRWLAWILLCALSVFFTEVVSGSTPSIFINIYGLLVTTPLYFLQLMVLLPLVFRTGKPGMGTLYLAGALFGLYEAYITKVIWSPIDYPVDWYVGGVAVFSTLMLVLFWHPLMSWIVPLFTADGLLNSSKTLKIRLPFQWLNRVKPVFLAAVPGGIMGIIHGASISKPAPALFSALSSTLVIWLLLRLWRHETGRTVFTMTQLMPSTKQWKVFAFLLAADYIVLGFAVRPAAFPSLAGHIIVAIMYVVIGGLLLLSSKADRKLQTQTEEVQTSSAYLKISSKNWLVFSAGFVILSVIASMLQDWSRQGVHYILWGLGITAGLAMFVWVIYRLIQKMDVHIKIPQIRRFFSAIKGNIRPGEKSNILRKIRSFPVRLPKIHVDLAALLKKARLFDLPGRFHRAQR
ncbi:MAG: hypothetical protein LLG42_04660 [Chloroflexi bacterium]|nr:hypothetical protein [Chloroflexota bacterium]